MEKRVLGRTNIEVSVLGFGGAEIGYERASVDTVSRLLGSALDAGLNVIDTAECYWGGFEEASSEYLIGQAVSHRRDEYHLFTKCGHNVGFSEADWTPELLKKSIERSLQRLKTDRLDLIQFHSCSLEQLQQGDIITVLQKARDAGKTRFIGYSGDNEAARYAITCGAFDTLQTSINIADQEAVTLTLPLAKEKNIGVIAKRPIANVAWHNGDDPPNNGYATTYWQRLGELGYPFLKTEDAVSTALRFTLALPGVHTAIVGTKNPDRWKSNADLLKAGSLDPKQFVAIRERWQTVADTDWVGQR